MDKERKIKLAKAKIKLMKMRSGQEDVHNLTEAHPDFSGLLGTFNRWGVKNLGGYGPEDFEKAIHTKWPNKYQTKIVDGAVLVKDGDTFKALDPQTGAFSSDFVGDVGDVAGDFLQGTVDTIGTGLGAVGGTFVAPGPGTVGGAALAGGATGAATEGTKQGLANLLGFRNGIDKADIAVNSAFGLASPLLLGTGSASKHGLKALAKKGISKKVYDKASRGLLSRAYGAAADKVGMPILEKASGIPKRALKTFKKYSTELDGMNSEKNLDRIEDFLSSMKNKVSSSKYQSGKEYAKAVGETGFKPNMKEIRKPIAEEIMNRKKIWIDSGKKNPLAKAKYIDARKQFKNVFKGMDDIPSENLIDFKSNLDDLADAHRHGKVTFGDRFTPTKSLEDKKLSNAFQRAAINLKDQIDNAGKDVPSLRKKFADNIKSEKFLNRNFKDEARTFKTLENLNNDSKEILRTQTKRIGEKYNIPIQKEMDLFNAYKYLNNSDLKRQAGLATLGASLGSLGGYQSGAGYSGAATGGIGGGAIGAALVSPKTIKWWLKDGVIKKGLKSDMARNNYWKQLMQQYWEN